MFDYFKKVPEANRIIRINCPSLRLKPKSISVSAPNQAVNEKKIGDFIDLEKEDC